MNRRRFFKKLFAGAVVTVVSPGVIAEIGKQSSKYYNNVPEFDIFQNWIRELENNSSRFMYPMTPDECFDITVVRNPAFGDYSSVRFEVIDFGE